MDPIESEDPAVIYDSRKVARELAEVIENRIGLHYRDLEDLITKQLDQAYFDLVGKWMEDELADYAMILGHCALTYEHFSGGRISKPNTLPSEVFAVAADLAQKDLEEAIVDTGYKQALEAIAEALKEPDGGSYALARDMLDQCGVYQDDINDQRVLGLLAETVLNNDVSARDGRGGRRCHRRKCGSDRSLALKED